MTSTLKFTLLLTLCSTLLACSSIPRSNYRDTTDLEVPPGYRIKTKDQAKTPEKSEQKKGLGKQVSLSNKAGKRVLKIDKSFDRAWIIVAKALELKHLKITDRNREQGIYHVDYDPDTVFTEDATDYFSFTFFSDQFEESSYQLTLERKANKVKVSAQIRPPKIDPDLYEDAEDREPPKDASTLLIQLLYKTIRDDLPNDIM